MYDWIANWRACDAHRREIPYHETDFPTTLDFQAHGVFPSIQLKKNDNEEDHVEMRRYYQSLRDSLNASDTLSCLDFFMTEDLKVWFTNSDVAMIFKLHWNR